MLFPRDSDSISEVFDAIKYHGLGDILDLELDSLQLERLMSSCWKLIKLVDESSYPKTTIKTKLEYGNIIIFNKNGMTNQDDRYLEIFGHKILLPLPSEKIKRKIPFDFSMKIDGVIKKHRLLRPKREGEGNTSAVLCNTKFLMFFVEYCLCFHSYCHYGHLLPYSYRSDLQTVDYGARKVIRYFDTLVYRGDNTCDMDTCKVHTQLRTKRNIEMTGDPMQTSCNGCERGLKSWAKNISKTAQKQGYGIFTLQTGKRVSDQIILSKAYATIVHQNKSINDNQQQTSECSSRLYPQFRIRKQKSSYSQVFVDRKNNEMQTTPYSGSLEKVIIKSIFDLEPEMLEINVWTEVKITRNNNILRACPNYRGEGPWYDWVYVWFHHQHSEEEKFPAKILAIYQNNNQEMKVLVHSVEYKTEIGCESLAKGDSRLITHYRQEFLENGHPALRSVYLSDIDQSVLVYQFKKYNPSPLPPKVSLSAERRSHTVMVIKPRNEWAKLFIDWTRELKWRNEHILEPTSQQYRLDVFLSEDEYDEMHTFYKTFNSS